LRGQEAGSPGTTELLERGTNVAFLVGPTAVKKKDAFMVLSSIALVRPALCAGLLLCAAATTASASDERCQQLVALNNQYKGVTLTTSQKQIKVQLVSWYKANCTKTRSASAAHDRSSTSED
jgi:hypothetical protein